MLLRLLLAMLLAGLSAGPLGSQPDVPPLTGRVVDRADLLSDGTEARLTEMLAEYEATTTHQIAVLTVPSLNGEVLEPFATEVFRTWGLGRADVDNGVLLLVARDDRELRIEVGLGLEGPLTDAEAGRIIRHTIVPLFRNGDFENGVVSGVSAIMGEIEGTYAPPGAAAASDDGFGFGEGFALLVALVGLLLAWRLAWGWVVKTGGLSKGRRRWSFAYRLVLGGLGLGLALFLGAPLLYEFTGLGRVEWWPGFWSGFLLWAAPTLGAEGLVRRSPVWRRYRQSQVRVERLKAEARKKGKKVTIHTWGRTFEYDGYTPPVSSSSYSSGSSYSSSSYSSSSYSSSSFSGGGGSSGGGGASGSW